MQSMTGHGSSSDGHGVVTVEIRSVNHRHLDLKIHGTPIAPSVEDEIHKLIRKAVQRGSVTVHITIRAGNAGSDNATIDVDRARAMFAELQALSVVLALEPPSLAMLIAQPSVWRTAARLDISAVKGIVIATVGEAMQRLLAMRSIEGKSLGSDLALRLQQLRAEVAVIARSADDLPARLRQRLMERLDSVKNPTSSIDPSRLAQEVALLVDRSDISEELVRLQSHFEQVESALQGAGLPIMERTSEGLAGLPIMERTSEGLAAGPIGRRLDFLAQEIARELSTIGAKSATAEISLRIVNAKTVLEKLREQVQNVE
jgi:uncharacterized protein (TIGR00255 family)